MVYGAVAAAIGMQLIADGLNWASPSGAIAQTSLILRITTAAGALVLVHNLYGQAAPASRSHIRLAMLGLALLWIYDLNLYTMAYLAASSARRLLEWRGLAVALTAPFLALGARTESGWRIRLSRAASFQSLSLLAICAYFALMAIVATALRGSGLDWVRPRLVVDGDGGAARRDDGGCDGRHPQRPRPRLAQGQSRKASVRAPLRLSQ